jgi:TP901 family phage tail tape measure protein
VASEIGDLYVVLRAVTEPFKASIKEAAAEGDAATTTMGRSFQKLAAVGLGVGAVAVTVVGVTTKWAADFQAATARLVTSAGETKDKLDLVRNGILDMSGQVGVSAQDLAHAMYYVEAAGFHASDGLTVLKAAAQGAAAEGADTTTVAQALTDVLKDYHLSAANAADITSKMITAVAHGKVNLQDFSAAFANIVPAASAAGISFNDIGAALSSMTNHGFTAQRASQNLAQALRSLLKPTVPMQKAFAQFGVSADELKAKLHGPNGLTDAMEYLSQAALKAGKEGTPEFAAAMRALMGTAPGANAALTTVGANLADTTATIKAMGSATADAQGRVQGFSLIQQTFSQKLKETEAGFQALGIKLGTVLLPYVEKFLGWVQKGVAWLTQHKSAVLALAGALGTALVAAIVAVGGALAAALGPEEAIALGVMAVGAALVYCYNHFKTFRTIVNGIASFLMGAFKVAWKVAEVVIRGFVVVWDVVAKAVKAIAKWFDDNVLKWIRGLIADFVSWWHDHAQEIGQVWDFVWKWIKTAFEVVWQGAIKPGLAILMSIWKVAWGIIKDSVMVVWGIIKGVVTTAIHYVMNTIGVVLDLITGHWSKAWHDMLHLVGQLMSDIGSAILHAAEGFGKLLWDAGKNVVMGLINGIKSMIGGVGNAIGSVASTIRSYLPFSPAKQGPLSGGGSPDIAGAKIGEMVATGMTQSTAKVTRAGLNLAGAAKLALTGRAGSGLQVGGLSLAVSAADGGGGTGSALPPIIVQVDGKKLFEILQVQALRYGRRNPTTGLVLTNR